MAGDITLIPPTVGDFHLSHLKVSPCMLQHHKTWDVPLLENIFDQQTVAAIINAPLYAFFKRIELCGIKSKMENILSKVHTDFACKSFSTFLSSKFLESGI